jgi:hypothetical protein
MWQKGREGKGDDNEYNSKAEKNRFEECHLG